MSTSPHINAASSTQKIMLDVIIAMIPMQIAAFILFGAYTLAISLVSVASAVFAEWLFHVMTKTEHTERDLSAVVTGMLLAFNLPSTVPIYLPILGSFFAIIIVKMLFGGLGKNFANPAITGRIFLMLCFAGAMGRFTAPVSLDATGIFSTHFDAVTGATPLAGGNADLLSLFLGTVPGCMGEVSALAILLGGLYLIIRRVIDWKIPVIYLATFAIMVCLVRLDIGSVLPQIFSGGLMLGAFFMATDYSTSPNSKWGVAVYAVGLGILSVVIREYSPMPEGVSFAILLMNVVTPLIDKFFVPRPFGYVKMKKPKKIKEAQDEGNR